MATDEEYLDSLLKSITESDQSRKMEDAIRDVSDDNVYEGEPEAEVLPSEPYMQEESFAEQSDEAGVDMDDLLGMLDVPEEPADMLAEQETSFDNSELSLDSFLSDTDDAEEALDLFSNDAGGDTEMPSDLFPSAADDSGLIYEEQPSDTFENSELSLEQLLDISDDSEEWKDDIDELLAQTDVDTDEDMLSADNGSIDEASLDILSGNTDILDTDFSDMDNADVTDLLDNMENTDSDLDEINSLLKRADKNQSVDDDMLALLESIDGNAESNAGDDDFDIFSDDMPEPSTAPSDTQSQKKKPKGKKQKGKKAEKNSKPIGKKGEFDSYETGIQSVLNEEGDEFQDDLMLEGLQEEVSGGEEGVEGGVKEEEGEKKEKSPGFFARFLDYISQEEDDLDVASDENAAILKELAKEDKAKKEEKKKKKAEKKDKGKGKSAKKANKKPKKEKKPKPVKEKKEKEPWENPFRVWSAKHIVVMLVFCASIIACICILVTFLPEYADKANAREAFYKNDYEMVYKMFYDKKLSGNDEIIFDRAKTILLLDRKLKSYENNMALGQELEAVDALIRGVECYLNLEGVDEYGVRGEIDALYQQIIIILENNYGITPGEAAEIYGYDSVTYTQRLMDAINGVGAMPEGESAPEESPVPMDILPEEEELLTGEGA